MAIKCYDSSGRQAAARERRMRVLDAIVEFAGGAMRAMEGMVPALQQAADEDDAVRELVDLARTRRRTTSAEIVVMATRHGVAQPDAVHTVYVLTSGETYLKYVEELGHTPQEYAGWLRRSIDQEVNG